MDRISELSNDVLGDILSLLPTKEAVATSILLRRWRKVCKWITSLDFKEPRFFCGAVRMIRFMEFIKKVLTHPVYSYINKFKFHLDYVEFNDHYLDFDSFYGSILGECITNAVGRGVKELQLSFGNMWLSKLTYSFFYCPTLVFLKLELDDCWYSVYLLTTARLPCLKIMNLRKIKMIGASFRNLFSGCPMVELYVYNCKAYTYDEEDFSIPAPLLRKLVVWNSYGFYRFDAPCLQSFKFRYLGFIGYEYNMTNLSSIYEAEIFVDLGIQRLIQLLQSVHNVSNLHFMGDTLEVWFCPLTIRRDLLSNISTQRSHLCHCFLTYQD